MCNCIRVILLPWASHAGYHCGLMIPVGVSPGFPWVSWRCVWEGCRLRPREPTRPGQVQGPSVFRVSSDTGKLDTWARVYWAERVALGRPGLWQQVQQARPKRVAVWSDFLGRRAPYHLQMVNWCHFSTDSGPPLTASQRPCGLTVAIPHLQMRKFCSQRRKGSGLLGLEAEKP